MATNTLASVDAFLAPGRQIVLWSDAGGLTGRGVRELVTVLDHNAVGILVCGMDPAAAHRGSRPQFIPWVSIKAVEAVDPAPEMGAADETHVAAEV